MACSKDQKGRGTYRLASSQPRRARSCADPSAASEDPLRRTRGYRDGLSTGEYPDDRPYNKTVSATIRLRCDCVAPTQRVIFICTTSPSHVNRSTSCLRLLTCPSHAPGIEHASALGGTELCLLVCSCSPVSRELSRGRDVSCQRLMALLQGDHDVELLSTRNNRSCHRPTTR